MTSVPSDPLILDRVPDESTGDGSESVLVESASILIVEDDRALARSLRRFVSCFAKATVKHCLADARAALETAPPYVGLLLDVNLPDGSGLDLLAELRTSGSDVPALVLTGSTDPGVPRHAQLYRAQFLPKPPHYENLRSFVDWALRRQMRPQERLTQEVERLAAKHGLSERETEILLLGCLGLDRIEIENRMGVGPSTIKTLVRRLLRKVGHPTLGDLVSSIHRSVFLDPE